MTPATRFLYRERVLSDDEAARRWQAELRHLLGVRNAAQQDLDDHLDSPPATVIVEQVELNPGDPGYDEAPVCFSPDLYHGQFKWVNTSTDDNDTP